MSASKVAVSGDHVPVPVPSERRKAPFRHLAHQRSCGTPDKVRSGQRHGHAAASAATEAYTEVVIPNWTSPVLGSGEKTAQQATGATRPTSQARGSCRSEPSPMPTTSTAEGRTDRTKTNSAKAKRKGGPSPSMNPGPSFSRLTATMSTRWNAPTTAVPTTAPRSAAPATAVRVRSTGDPGFTVGSAVVALVVDRARPPELGAVTVHLVPSRDLGLEPGVERDTGGPVGVAVGPTH